jgi:hypothetical protein
LFGERLILKRNSPVLEIDSAASKFFTPLRAGDPEIACELKKLAKETDTRSGIEARRY